MVLTTQNNISIAEVCIYVVALAIAIFLCVRHGFARSSGWLYLIIFSLARIIGSCLSLATIAQPQNLSLYMGAVTLQNVGLSPLILTLLGLLARSMAAIRNGTSTSSGSGTQTVVLDPRVTRLTHLVVLVALILGIVGGTQSGQQYANTGTWTPSSLSRAGTGLMIAGFGLTVLATAVVATRISAAEPGERRVVLAVGLALPFVLVRLIYSAESTFGGNPQFNMLKGDVNIQLGMSVITEMLAIAIIEGFGLTLKRLSNEPRLSPLDQRRRRRNDYEMSPTSLL